MKSVFAKRGLALLLTVLVLMSVCPVAFAGYEASPTPEIGVVLDDDFEAYNEKSDAQRKKSGIYYDGCMGEWPVTVNGDKVWSTMSHSGRSTLYWQHAASDAQDIDTGIFIIEQNISVNSGYTGSITKNGHYPSVYFRYSDHNDQNGVTLCAVSNMGDKGGIIFTGTGSITDSMTADTYKTFTADEDHILRFVFDYTNDETRIYFDDVLENTIDYAMTFKVNSWYGFVNHPECSGANFAADDSGVQPAVLVDDLYAERLGAISATASATEADKIEVKFSSRVKPISGFAAEDIIVQDSQGQTLAVSSFEMNKSRNMLTIHLEDSLTVGSSYTVDLGDGQFIGAAHDQFVYNTPGTGLFFTLAVVRTDVLNVDFETETFPVNSTEGRDVDWMNVQVSSGTDNQYSDMSDWVFGNDSREYAYATQTTMNASRAMKFTMWTPVSRSQAAQSLVLPFDQPVSGGTLTVEFDVDIVSASGARFAFGLHDRDDNITNYNPWEAWGDATYFGGLTYWTGAATKDLKTNAVDKPNMLPDGYLYHNTPESSGYNPGDGTWATEPTSHVVEQKMVDSESFPGTYPSEHWKYVIDLDAEVYEFYVDGVLKKTMTYIPGDEAGTYDAFVATILLASTGNSAGADRELSIYLDNVKATHLYSLPVAERAYLTDYNGRNISLTGETGGVTTGVTQAVVEFSTAMDPSSAASQVSVTAPDTSVNYSVGLQDKKLVISFPDGLLGDTRYTISLGDIKSLYGQSMSETVSYSFTTAQGEQSVGGLKLRLDGAPLNSLKNIGADSEISLEVTAINTDPQSEPIGGTIILAAYQNNMLLGTKTAQIEAKQGVYTQTMTVNAGEDGFVGADQIRAFVFDSLDTLRPLTVSNDIPGDKAYVVLNEHDNLNYATEIGGVTSARIGNGSTPVKETRDGFTGWRLDAGNQGSAYVAIDLSGLFAEGLSSDQTVQVEVDYYDDHHAGFGIAYQGTDGKLKHAYCQMTDTDTWKTATFNLYDASFNDDCEGYDLYLAINDRDFTTTTQRAIGRSPYNTLLKEIRLTKVKDTISPYDISVETGKPGNVFVYGTYGDSLSFDVTYSDPAGKHTKGTATYTVKNYSGEEVWSTTQEFTGGEDKVQIPFEDLKKHGTYTMDIEVTGNRISQKTTVDFASSLEGVTNLHYGTNLHYDYNVYSQQDIKDQIDLVKSAGIGFTRSKIDWNSVEPEPNGEYVMDQNVLYANQYLDSLGMEHLCILNQQNWAYIGDSYPYHYLTTQAQRDAWANFCTYIVNQFKDYTSYYAVGNEFNLQGPGGWHPYENYNSNHNADNYSYYVDIVKAAYPAIKAADENAVVIAGEIGRYEDEWAEECYKLGIADYMDVFSYHTYGHGASLERYVDETAEYADGSGYTYHDLSPWASASKWRDYVHSHTNTQTGEENKAWLTEIGVASRDDSIASKFPEVPVTHTQQARILVRTYALIGRDIDKIFLYNFTNNESGYLDTDGECSLGIINSHDHRTPFSVKPAYVAISAYNHFTGCEDFVSPAPEYIGSEEDRRERGYQLTFNNTQYGTTLMAWKSEGAGEKLATLNIPGAAKLDVYDMYGSWVAEIENGASWSLSIDPVYVVKAN